MHEPRIAARVRAVTTDSQSLAGTLQHWVQGHSGRSLSALVVAIALVAGGGAAAAASGVLDGASPGPAPAETPSSTGSPASPSVPAATDAPPAPPPSSAAPAARATGPAYRVASTNGSVYEHGWFDDAGSASRPPSSAIVGLAQSDDGEGYWLASADGGVFSFGDAEFLGSAAGATSAPVANIVSTPSRHGYWLVARNGGVFSFGDAGFFGAGVDLGLSHGIVSMASTPTGNGYWLVSSDGGVFAFGDAGYLGSLGDQEVNARIVELVPTPTGQGYYLVASDGGVFTFGDATFFGSAVDERLAKPIVDMALDPDGDGYWLLSGDGGIYTYGNAPFLGAPAADRVHGSFTAIAAGRGFHDPAARVAAAAASPAEAPSAQIASAPAEGAAPPAPTAARPTAHGTSHGASKSAAAALVDNASGWDVSFPQCDAALPAMPFSYAIVGITGGRPFRTNRCLADQWRWARQSAAGVYLNVSFPRDAGELAAGATSDRQPDCAGQPSCVAYNFGLNGARDGLAYARSKGVVVPFVWLDIEQLNHWTRDQPLNAVVIRGAVDAVREAGMAVGIYSTPFQFRKIAGDEQFEVPVWSAGAPGLDSVADFCVNRGFAGGPAALVQLLPEQFDVNVACPGAGPIGRYFTLPGK